MYTTNGVTLLKISSIYLFVQEIQISKIHCNWKFVRSWNAQFHERRWILWKFWTRLYNLPNILNTILKKRKPYDRLTKARSTRRAGNQEKLTMFNRPRPGNTNRRFLSEQAGVSSITTNNGSRSIMSGLGFTDLLSAHVPLADDTRRSLMNSTTRALYHSFPTHCWFFFLATRARYKNPRHHADLCPWNETFSHVEPEPNFLTDGKNVIKWPADFSDAF